MAILHKIKFSALSRDLRLDADYYRPEYIRQERLLANIGAMQVEDLPAKVSDGNHSTIAGDFLDEKDRDAIRYLRGQDLGEFFLSDTESRFIPRDFYETIGRSHMRPGDVLVVIVGAMTGNVALVTERYSDITGSCKIGIVRPSDFSSEFLAVYLASAIGQAEIRRRIRGSAQGGLILPDLRAIPVPLLGESAVEKVEQLVKKAKRSYLNAIRLYPEAESEMLSRLGWPLPAKASEEKTYVQNFASVVNASRADAEFFQPRYAQLRLHLDRKGSQCLGDFCQRPFRGVHPTYAEKGERRIVNSKHLGPLRIDTENLERTTDAFYESAENKYAQLRLGDVLTYSTGAYIGRTNVWLEDQEAICGVDVTVTRPDQTICLPAFLALFLNSPPGIMLSIQSAIGSGQRHIYPSQLVNYPVFLPRNGSKVDMTWQKALSEKVIASNAAFLDAHDKIAKAKALIETEIATRT